MVIFVLMTDSGEFLSGASRPRPTEDPFVAGKYQELGLGETPSLTDIKPHALEMMRSLDVFGAMGIVLGREVNAEEARADPELRAIAMTAVQDPEEAYGWLIARLTLEEIEAEARASMPTADHELSVEARDNSVDGDPVLDFYVIPPVTSDEVKQIERAQGPSSMLGELMTFYTPDDDTDFRIPGSDDGLGIVLASELASTVMSLRGLRKAAVIHNGREEISISS
jgi:hypothetical protein